MARSACIRNPSAPRRSGRKFDVAQMKYFTPDIWAGWQGNEAVFARAQRKWNRNLSRYKSNLPGLARRLGQRRSSERQRLRL